MKNPEQPVEEVAKGHIYLNAHQRPLMSALNAAMPALAVVPVGLYISVKMPALIASQAVQEDPVGRDEVFLQAYLHQRHGERPMGLELHVVDLGLDATDADLMEQMRHMDAHRTAGFKRVGCSIRGYEADSRDLWQIPEVVDFCKKLVRIGFIAGLDVSFTFPPNQPPLPVPVVPMGSLDIWLVAKGHMRKDGTVEMTKNLLNQFNRELQYLNTVSEDMLSGKNPGASN